MQKVPSPKSEQKRVDAFNEKYKVGDTVRLKKDNGEIIETTVAHSATLLSGHTAVGWFTGVSGCYNLSSVQP